MKKMGKMIALALAVIFALALVTACGGNSGGGEQPAGGGSGTAPAPAGSGSSGAAPVVHGEYTGPEMTLSVNLSSSKANAEYLTNTFDRITERTDGKVKFDITEFSGLLDTASALEGLGTGVADISDLTLSNYPESFVYTTQVCAQPFNGFKDIFSANDIIRDVIITNPDEIMTQEFTAQNVKPLSIAAVFGTSLFLAGDQRVVNPEDLNGIKIQTDDQVISEFINSQGGAAVKLDIMNMASNMKNGVADGAMVAQNVGDIFGAAEATKTLYAFAIDLSTHIKTTSICLDTWNKFDDTLKNIFTEEFGDKMYTEYLAWVEKMENQRHDKWETEYSDMKQNMITEAQIPTWKAAITPFAEKQLNALADSHPDIEKAKEIWRTAIDTYYEQHK